MERSTHFEETQGERAYYSRLHSILKQSVPVTILVILSLILLRQADPKQGIIKV